MTNDTARATRRAFLGGVSATAILPHLAVARDAPPSFVTFADKARALSGFDVIARPLLRDVFSVFSQTERSALDEGTDDRADLEKALLKALYTGKHAQGDASPQRLAYADALMYAAIEDTVNVPSYCGGVPGYWAQKPRTS